MKTSNFIVMRTILIALSLVMVLLIPMQVFAQEEDAIIEQIDLQLDERISPDPPLPIDHPLRFVEDIAESFELAIASPQEKPLIKLKHAEKRILEMERAILEGKPELIERIQAKYIENIRDVKERVQDTETRGTENDDRIQEVRIKNKIAERLGTHEEYFAERKALLVLEAVRQDHFQRGIPVSGLDQAIERASSILRREAMEEKEEIKDSTLMRLNQITVEIQRDDDTSSVIPDITKQRIIEQTKRNIELPETDEIPSSVTTIVELRGVDIEQMRADATSTTASKIPNEIRERAVRLSLLP